MDFINSGFLSTLIAVGIFAAIIWFYIYVSRYKRCPSDQILVVYGKISGLTKDGKEMSAHCYHGGGRFIWPIIQNYQFMTLTPIPIDIKLEGALSQQNIRINTPSTFTVGISTDEKVMQNAAERLLALSIKEIETLAKDIIFGQMRVVLATMPIEEINADREKLIENIFHGVEVELHKIGLRLINVNIHDITDESGYIDALGKEAVSRAVNEAKIKVAEQERDGEIGKAVALRDQRINVANADAVAVEGENKAKVQVAQSNAQRREREAEAERVATAAEKVKSAQALQEAYSAEEQAERERAKREEATQVANIIVPVHIEKRRIETIAEAEAEQIRRVKKGEASGLLSLMEAEANGLRAILTRKAEGFSKIVQSCDGSAESASLMLITEQLPRLVEEQVKAISNLKIDSITVWDNGKQANGKTKTADFLSGLIGSLPPLHDLTKNVGIGLPEFLGKLTVNEQTKALTPQEEKGKTLKHEQLNEKDGREIAMKSALKQKPLIEKIPKETASNKAPKQEQAIELKQEQIIKRVPNEVAEKKDPKKEQNNEKIRKEVVKNIELITVHRKNQKAGLDNLSIDHVAKTVLKWVEKTKDENLKWFYSKTDQIIGPHTWPEIKEILKDHPTTLIKVEGSKVLLPMELILFVAGIIL